MSARGALLFARYAYPPNELGYCGPADASALLDSGATAGIERRARQFEGAWCYLEFLAEAAGIPDPLDERVVEAYWIGNDLLEQAGSAALVDRMLDRFRGQIGGTWREAAHRALAHHSFQVFDVYPWAHLLRTTDNLTALTVLDQCRIRTGVVLDVAGESATVTSSPLSWSGTAVETGPQRQEVVRWSTGGRTLLDGLSPGDRVALHWDWVCDVLTEDQVARVESLEARQRNAHSSMAR
ncbi:hypothetical protein G3I60_01285 [Streptomyces sp. SID13666]|uniref:DUF6390 family protein n=1 Tax=Streptomyces TaxID=1883 RepID=UPI0013BF7C24|nr:MULTISPECIES: DUF6390 family protein [Streptomyces]MCZ4095174.1 DUF6390 family protein [Streptomyces sp. H39-C1]NEA52839.1 hypothetical protein [Streptomyces sp. SID13666]NEA69834.1 hypothetical protein [Streptomyces sp. SID13588]